VLLAYAAAILAIGVTGKLAERARLAGQAGLGRFTESASLPMSVVITWVALGLALHHGDWTAGAVLPVAYAAWAAWRALRHRRGNG
jgi:hypothetical protein